MTCGITQGEAEVFIEELIDAVKKNEREKSIRNAGISKCCRNWYRENVC